MGDRPRGGSVRWFRNLWVRMGGKPPWLDIPKAGSWDSHTDGTHKFEAVSRHSIAESGLVCPRCETPVCPRGDYSFVRTSHLGEVVKCNGKREAEGREVACEAILAASPDTEHGDNLIYDAIPPDERKKKFYSFVRISEAKALADKYDASVAVKNGVLSTNAAERKIAEQKKKYEYKEGEAFVLSDKRVAHVVRVQHTGDVYFDGWAKCVIHGAADGLEWDLDPWGKVRQSLRDPTLNDTLFIVEPVAVV